MCMAKKIKGQKNISFPTPPSLRRADPFFEFSFFRPRRVKKRLKKASPLCTLNSAPQPPSLFFLDSLHLLIPRSSCIYLVLRSSCFLLHVVILFWQQNRIFKTHRLSQVVFFSFFTSNRLFSFGLSGLCHLNTSIKEKKSKNKTKTRQKHSETRLSRQHHTLHKPRARTKLVLK